MNYIRHALHQLRRPLAVITALGLAVSGGLPALTNVAFAAGQVQNRSIQISDGRPGATGVSYKVTYTPATAGAQSLIVDFCASSAIIGDACTSPAGMSFASASFTAGTGTASWTMAAVTGTTVKITKGGGAALGTSAIDFTVTGVVNPSATGTFFARTYTYSDTAYGGGSPYTGPTTLGNYVDYGGFALTTTDTVQVTATVMETLTFCVSKSDNSGSAPAGIPGDGCTSLNTPALTLGHGSPAVLDSTAVDTDWAATQMSTNALHGAVVTMKNVSSSACAGLSNDNGATCPIPAVSGTLATITNGTAAFGVNVSDGIDGGNPVGSTTANANYGSGAGYTMQAATYGTYGDPIFSSASVCNNINNVLEFAATADVTTPAGVYTVNESLIATGTF